MPDKSALDPNTIPRHVAIIMDGNGRWANRRGMPRIMGHKAGTKAVKKIVTAAKEIGVSVLTLYAFSTENWKRPAMEVKALMALLKTFLKAERATMLKNNIILRGIGEIEKLPPDVYSLLNEVSRETRENVTSGQGMVLNLALNYGGRTEIINAAKLMAEKCMQGMMTPADFTEELFADHLYTAGLPDPDLVIRTGGEARLSNFLLWQASYAELYITDVMWPEFKEDNLLKALSCFQNRERRFGKTGEQVRA